MNPNTQSHLQILSRVKVSHRSSPLLPMCMCFNLEMRVSLHENSHGATALCPSSARSLPFCSRWANLEEEEPEDDQPKKKRRKKEEVAAGSSRQEAENKPNGKARATQRGPSILRKVSCSETQQSFLARKFGPLASTCTPRKQEKKGILRPRCLETT